MVFSDFLFADVLEYVDNSTFLELLTISDTFVIALSVQELERRARKIHGTATNQSNWDWLNRVPEDDQFDCYLEMFQNEPCDCRRSSSYYSCPVVNSSRLLSCFQTVYSRSIDRVDESIAHFNFYEQVSVTPLSWRITDTGLRYLQTIAKRFETQISAIGVAKVLTRLIAVTPLDKDRAVLFGKLFSMFTPFLNREVFEKLRSESSYNFKGLCKLLMCNNHGPLIQQLIDHGPEEYTSDESLAIIQAVRKGNEALPNRLLKLKRFPVDKQQFVIELAANLSHHEPPIRQFALKVFAQVPTGMVHPMRLESILDYELPTSPNIEITEFQSIVCVFKDKSWAKDARGKFTRYHYSGEFIERLINRRGFRYGLAALDLIPKRINLRLSDRLYISREHLAELEWHPAVNKVIRTEVV